MGLQSVLMAIVVDHGFDQDEFMERYLVEQGTSIEGGLLRKASGNKNSAADKSDKRKGSGGARKKSGGGSKKAAEK